MDGLSLQHDFTSCIFFNVDYNYSAEIIDQIRNQKFEHPSPIQVNKFVILVTLLSF